MKRILVLILTSIAILSCSKDEDNNTAFNDQLEGKEYHRDFNAALNYSIEFYKQGEIRFATKNKGSNTLNEHDEYKYYKWTKVGSTGNSISVTIPADANFPEREIRGLVTGDILSFGDYPLEGAYTLVR